MVNVIRAVVVLMLISASVAPPIRCSDVSC